jgi:hypothetical protein
LRNANIDRPFDVDVLVTNLLKLSTKSEVIVRGCWSSIKYGKQHLTLIFNHMAKWQAYFHIIANLTDRGDDENLILVLKGSVP